VPGLEVIPGGTARLVIDARRGIVGSSKREKRKKRNVYIARFSRPPFRFFVLLSGSSFSFPSPLSPSPLPREIVYPRRAANRVRSPNSSSPQQVPAVVVLRPPSPSPSPPPSVPMASVL